MIFHQFTTIINDAAIKINEIRLDLLTDPVGLVNGVNIQRYSIPAMHQVVAEFEDLPVTAATDDEAGDDDAERGTPDPVVDSGRNGTLLIDLQRRAEIGVCRLGPGHSVREGLDTMGSSSHRQFASKPRRQIEFR